jgi:hypothetical protein
MPSSRRFFEKANRPVPLENSVRLHCLRVLVDQPVEDLPAADSRSVEVDNSWPRSVALAEGKIKAELSGEACRAVSGLVSPRSAFAGSRPR